MLGRSLGALTAAALLARRDFRVLLLGHGQRPASYRFEGHVLCRRPFTLLAGSSPAWQRVLRELAQIPRFRRRTEALDPMFCFLSSGQRMQVPPVVDLFAQEVDREFPEVRQLVDELYAGLAKVNRAADAAFEKDLVWPPGRLWERLETGRAAASLPYLSGSEQDLLAKFPAGHPYRILTLLPAAFGTDLAVPGAELPMFALARLHGSWTRGIQMLKRGEDDLAEFLMDRIEAHGGHLGLDRRVENIVVEHGRAVGVKLDGADEMTGAGCIVADQPGELVAELAAGRGITKQALRDWPRLTPRAG
ncbi:MAG TPA: NAD(P)-binding protein, partial [Polyangiaceae bacterium]